MGLMRMNHHFCPLTRACDSFTFTATSLYFLAAKTFCYFGSRGLFFFPSYEYLKDQASRPKKHFSKTSNQIATMSKTSLQYQIPKQGGSFTDVSVPHPTPGPDEICIRTRAVALNPLDWKSRAFGVMVQSWPAVLGVDAAGVIDSVGESVKDFEPGDEVFTLCGMGNRAGAFQEIITVPSHLVAKKPVSLTFEEAASLP